MPDFTVCNVCEHPGTFENSAEINQVFSNVRKFKDQKFTVWRCSSCRSLHSKEEVDLDYYYKHYPVALAKKEELPSTSSYSRNRIFYKRLQLLQKRGFKREHELLDYGCGNGDFLSFLQQLGYQKCFGYDPYSPNYSNKKVLERKYDFIVSYDVIEHVNEPRQFIKDLVDSLKVGGLFVVATPNADGIDLSKPELFVETHQPYHRHLLSEKALLNLGSSQGITAIEVYKRCYFDTLYLFVNTRFIWGYVHCTGGFLNALYEPPRLRLILTSPILIFYAVAGYFFPTRANMIIFFRCNP